MSEQPLHVAAADGRLEAVQCLVDEFGAKPAPLDRCGPPEP